MTRETTGVLAGGALLAGYLLVFGPAQVHHANVESLRFPFWQLLLILLPVSVLSGGALLLPVRWLGRRASQAYGALLAGLAVAVWVTGSFLAPAGLVLDGIGGSLPPSTGDVVRDGVIFLLAAVAVGAMAVKRPRLVRSFLVLLVLLLGIATAVMSLSVSVAARTSPTPGSVTRMSGQDDLLVIVMDAFQSDFMDEILRREPDLIEAFRGFTFFTDAMSPSPTTYLSLPVIHSGERFRDGEVIERYMQTAIRERSFLTRLARDGYTATLVNDVFNVCPNAVACTTDRLFVRGLAAAAVTEAVLLVDVSVYRALPSGLRPRGVEQWSLPLTRALTAESPATAGNAVLTRFGREVSLDPSRSRIATFLHVFSTHAPAELDAECRPTGRPRWTRGTALDQAHCATRVLATVLETLQEKRLFDPATIVILSDHGTGLGSARVAADGVVDREFSRLVSAASALLLVKPARATGPLQRDASPVHLADVSGLVLRLLAEPSAMPSLAPGHRPRFFVDYRWHPRLRTLSAFPITKQYEVEGPLQRKTSWRTLPRVAHHRSSRQARARWRRSMDGLR